MPNPGGDQCVTPEEAAVPAPLGDATIVSTWDLPMKMPRGLAVTDTAVWTVNLDTEALTQLVLGDDGQATIALEIPLGADAWRITDLAATDDQVFLARRGLVEQRIGQGELRHASSIILVDAETQELQHLAGNNVGDMSGIAIGDGELITVDGMFHRRSLVNGTEQGLPQMFDIAGGVSSVGQLLLKPAGYPGVTATLGLSFTRNQLIRFLGTSYDGATFVGRFDVLNGAGTTVATPLQAVAVPINGSHVAGFDFDGGVGWLAVGGSGLAQPIIEKVSFDDAL